MIELFISQDEWPTEQQADGMVVDWTATVGEKVEQGQVILDIVVVIYPHTDFYLSNLGTKNRFLCRWAFPFVEPGKSV